MRPSPLTRKTCRSRVNSTCVSRLTRWYTPAAAMRKSTVLISLKMPMRIQASFSLTPDGRGGGRGRAPGRVLGGVGGIHEV